MNAPGATNWGTPLVGAVAALTAARLGRGREAYEYAAATPNRQSEAEILAEMIDQELAGLAADAQVSMRAARTDATPVQQRPAAADARAATGRPMTGRLVVSTREVVGAGRSGDPRTPTWTPPSDAEEL
jgi:hypothetical protein